MCKTCKQFFAHNTNIYPLQHIDDHQYYIFQAVPFSKQRLRMQSQHIGTIDYRIIENQAQNKIKQIRGVI